MYSNEEVIAVASERPALCTVFDVPPEEIREIAPASALIVKRRGDIQENQYIGPLPPRRCTFERIYFSRGNDADIYVERK